MLSKPLPHRAIARVFIFGEVVGDFEEGREVIETMAQSNPNGANQYALDPRQKLCWDYYVNPTSETFGNATQSAIKAGYTEVTADVITSTDWFSGRLWRLNATFTGEKKMKELMELDLLNGGDKVDIGIARIQADIAKYLTSTQGKREGYTTASETDITSGGKAINTLEAIPPEALAEMRKIYEDAMKKKLTKGE